MTLETLKRDSNFVKSQLVATNTPLENPPTSSEKASMTRSISKVHLASFDFALSTGSEFF